MSDHIARIQALFGGDAFKFARWGGPICPVIVGLDDKGTQLFEEAISAVVDLAGAKIDEIDPEMGANMMVYIMGDWAHAAQLPNLPNFIPDLPALVERLNKANANRYRVFAFDDQGAIRASITMLRYDEQMQEAPVDYIALTEAMLAMLVFDERGVLEDRPVILAKFEEDDEDIARAVVNPWHGRLLAAAYDPTIPAGSNDPSVALRLAARIGVGAQAEFEEEDEEEEEDDE
jgi:hypothetical protein